MYKKINGKEKKDSNTDMFPGFQGEENTYIAAPSLG